MLKITRDIPPYIYNLEGPLIVISNHPSYLDPFLSAICLYPLRINYLASESFFRNPLLRYLLKKLGAIPKIQFRPDSVAVKAMLRVIKRGGNLGVFPEGTRTIHGASMPIEKTFAKFVKKARATVIALKIHGGYLTSPRWAKFKIRNGGIHIEARKILDPEEIQDMEEDILHKHILEALDYNDYDFQKTHKGKYKTKDPALGLHNIIHQCPRCKKNQAMNTKGNEIFCIYCGNKAKMSDEGFLLPESESDVVFPDPVQWNSWQIENMTPTVLDPDFLLSAQVKTFETVNETSFSYLGEGVLNLSHSGFLFTQFHNSKRKDKLKIKTNTNPRKKIGTEKESKSHGMGNLEEQTERKNNKASYNLDAPARHTEPTLDDSIDNYKNVGNDENNKKDLTQISFSISGIWGIRSNYGVFFDLVGEEKTYRFYTEEGQKCIMFSQALDILRDKNK